MCGKAPSPVIGIGMQPSDDLTWSTRLRKSRSFQDLATSEEGCRAALLGKHHKGGGQRRISSLENLVALVNVVDGDQCGFDSENRSEGSEGSTFLVLPISQTSSQRPLSMPMINSINDHEEMEKKESTFFHEAIPLPSSSTTLCTDSSGASSPKSHDSLNASLSQDTVCKGSLLLEEGRRVSCDLGHVAPSTGHLGQGPAAVELFYRLNHARQTVEYVKRQAGIFSSLSRATMDVWEALALLGSLREYEAVLLDGTGFGSNSDNDMSLIEHAFQSAEACRIAFPQYEWAGLVGLIHGLGKLLAHVKFGAEPQWAVCGESFPIGCRFHPAIVYSHYFQANPDRRRRALSTPTGLYQPGCGLGAVCMSWSGAEYLYMVLARNRTLLPPEALFLIRYQKFYSLMRPGQPYGELLSPFDRSMLPILAQFQKVIEYCRMEVPGRLEGQAFQDYYDSLLDKYIPQGTLRW